MCLAIPACIEVLTTPCNAIFNLGGVRKEISLVLVDDAAIAMNNQHPNPDALL
jgi:hydrogenase expression/formation protein HypC